jgi:hypothetical protein
MIPVGIMQQRITWHVRHANSVGMAALTNFRSGRPALRLADDEVPEYLHAGYGLQLFGIHKVRIKLN